MLQNIRDGAQGIASKIIVGAIIFVMAIFGFGGFFSGGGAEPTVAEVNGEDIGQSSYDNALERLRARSGITDEVLLRRTALDELVRGRLLRQDAESQDLVVAQETVDARILNDPNFSIAGQFNADTYRALLSQNGLSPASYSELVKEDIAVAQLTSGLVGSDFSTDAELKRMAALTEQRRSIAWLPLAAATYADEVVVEEGAAEAFYDENAELFQEPEMVKVDYVRLSAGSLTVDAPTEDALRQAYDDEVAAQAGQRRVAHIMLLLEDRSEAEAVAALTEARARLDAGATFASLASELSEDPSTKDNGGELPFRRQEDFTDEFAVLGETLWQQDVGVVSEPIVSPFGVHLLQVIEEVSVATAAFEDRREGLNAELLASTRSEMFASLRSKLAQQAFGATNVQEIAQEFELELQESEFFPESGAAQGIASFPGVVTEAFSAAVLNERVPSQVVDVGGDAVVLGLNELRPSRQKEFAEVEAEVVAQLKKSLLDDMIITAQDQALAAMRDNGNATVVAADANAAWQRAELADRQQAGVPPSVRRAAFALPRPQEDRVSVGSAEAPDGAIRYVVTVSQVVDGDAAALTEAESEGLARLVEVYGARRLVDGYVETLKNAASINRRE